MMKEQSGMYSIPDMIVLTTAQDMQRTMKLYYKFPEMLNVDRIFVIGNNDVAELVEQLSNPVFQFLNEEELISFETIQHILKDIFDVAEIGRGFVGWYYQQFLKMAYSLKCSKQWYLAWDGDTIPVRHIELFDNDGTPYMDWKREYIPSYFRTISSIFPEMKKSVEMSFISEHMLFSTKIMNEMITEIENKKDVEGTYFYEKILRCIDKKDLNGQGFSEFETYGTYLIYRYIDKYRMRRWFSYRNCGQYFRVDDISEEEMKWFGKDFHAITFEKGHLPVENAAFIRDPKYREKLSARQVVEIIQENADGWKESWD